MSLLKWLVASALFLNLGCATRQGDLFQNELLGKIQGATTQRYLDPQKVDDYYKTGESEANQKKLRNDLVAGLVSIVDYDYYQYELRLSNTVRSVNFGLDVTNLGLTAAAAFVNGEQAKTTLAALATLIGGTRLAVDKNLFYETTLPLLIGRMEALRETRRTKLIEKRGVGVDVYPLEFALSDIYAYYQAGTITAASADIASENATKTKDAKINQDKLTTTKPN